MAISFNIKVYTPDQISIFFYYVYTWKKNIELSWRPIVVKQNFLFSHFQLYVYNNLIENFLSNSETYKNELILGDLETILYETS